ncbi:fungal-specific transcription factor domain-containing protein [Desarmillaria tabescens]|uniref:Fungal-specific transcription factor domain-containing protein n=1 Tax=Armillaria tabescens TaxID=1929756 RepID=A0AA39KG28_ARMTA|nr:fungal-specific transcription factor domain-containing protein [Desarmillaria tabescens]KAK0459300.1 fungal-specific transcription factor domain-containing protein [Desarmillaria tabescens]
MMRKGESSSSGAAATVKKRRMPRACDMCKRKKGDSEQMPGKRCTNCISFNYTCTHVEALNEMTYCTSYVQRLERRLRKLELLFQQFLPDVDIDTELTEGSTDEEPSSSKVGRTEYDQSVSALSKDMSRLLSVSPEQRFFGKSSGIPYIPLIMQKRAQYLGKEKVDPMNQALFMKRREQFWDAQSYYSLRIDDSLPDYLFPEEDLMLSLIDLYFTYHNCYLPLLHRPTFENDMSTGLHRSDYMFAGTLLLVCALGARNSDDPRVFYGCNGEAGWQWFEQITPFRSSLQDRSTTTLYELQIHCLSSLYLESVGLWESVWTQVGLALRLAQDVGAHMHRSNPPNARDELWKRAFWVLMFLDVSLACLHGHAVTLHYEDFDLDFPLECDDAFWSHPDSSQNFTQPPEQPSEISFFVYLLKLVNIMSYVKDIIYYTRKPLMVIGGQRRPPETEIVSNLDSVLDRWVQSIPGHLRWDPSRKEQLFFNQSGFLYITYQYTRILLHRPYIPRTFDSKITSTLYPSVATCVEAANKRRGYIQSAFVNSVTLTLLLIVWSGHSPGSDPLISREMQNVDICSELASSEMPNVVPQSASFAQPTIHKKRPREVPPPEIPMQTPFSYPVQLQPPPQEFISPDPWASQLTLETEPPISYASSTSESTAYVPSTEYDPLVTYAQDPIGYTQAPQPYFPDIWSTEVNSDFNLESFFYHSNH